ncbi:Glycine cleavage system H protein, mitochondrial [Candida viswanathii]|uniref:Glycine cleavage system H protein n=1 Tax=Candida viswanathii TaxID=5486 RepID=A0A367YCP2_9ASCO|nr:Glycine cleavage system H protein, mitochondrial [Candida viswanathii]
MIRTLFRPATFRLAMASTTPVSVRAFSTFPTRFQLLNKNDHLFKYLHEKTPVVTKFTEDHEWVNLYDDDSAFVGITQYAAQALGDVTYVDLPEVGDRVSKGEPFGSVESVKSSADVYSPVDGEVVGVNLGLESEPGTLNHDPTVEGWIVHIKLDDAKQITESETLLDEAQYVKFVEEEEDH